MYNVNEPPKTVIGKCKVTTKLIEWLRTNSSTWSEEVYNEIYKLRSNKENRGNIVNSESDHYYNCNWLTSALYELCRSNTWAKNTEDCVKDLEYIRGISQRLDLYWKNDNLAFVKVGILYYLVLPTNILDIELYKDYYNISVSELKKIGGNAANTLIKAEDATTAAELDKRQLAQEEQLKQLDAEFEAVKKYENAEMADLKKQLDEIKAQLDEKQRVLMEQLNAKKEQMEDTLRGMKAQIFSLDSQIYAIRCYLGEVIDFVKLRDGKTGDDKAPVILYQKFHYLDEDLGRYMSIYDFEGEDTDTFERLLRCHDGILNIFCPTPRCVSLVRVSREGIRQTSYAGLNIVEAYAKYHGGQIGILIRDGDTLYCGWTDEDRVSVKDDLFVKPQVKVVDDNEANNEPNPAFNRPLSKKELWEKQLMKAKEMASRVFLFSIVQGAIEKDPPLLTFDEKPSIFKPDESSKLIFSAAENWLSDNRYGDFADIIKRCNDTISIGDTIITLLNICPHSGAQYMNRNDRGRGYADRTHDCKIKDCCLYKINHIDKKTELYAYYLRTDNNPKNIYQTEDTGIKYSYCTRIYNKNAEQKKGEDVLVAVEEQVRNDYYVSIEKDWSFAGARSNVQVYKDEFINLSYMNSAWLLYVINNRTLGNWNIPSTKSITYAYAIKYLNKALEYVRTREDKELKYLTEIMPGVKNDSEWCVKLSEWKLSTHIREINRYQAKRFIKWYNQQ